MSEIVITEKDAWNRGLKELEKTYGLYEQTFKDTDAGPIWALSAKTSDVGPFYILLIETTTKEPHSELIVKPKGVEVCHNVFEFPLLEDVLVAIKQLEVAYKNEHSSMCAVCSRQSIIDAGRLAFSKE